MGVLVGLGVGVGPLVVGVGEGVAVLVATVGLGVATVVVVADGVGVRGTMGVQVGVGVWVGGKDVTPGIGMINTCPARINAGLVMLLASANASTVTPNRTAISDRVSPGWTV